MSCLEIGAAFIHRLHDPANVQQTSSWLVHYIIY